MLRQLLALALTLCASTLLASPPLPPIDTDLARDYEVLRDELPDNIDPSDLDIVLIGRKATCVREPLTLWGVRTGWSNSDYDQRVCDLLIPLVQVSAPAPQQLRHALVAELPRSVQSALADLNPSPTRRYVAMVRWSMWPLRHYNHIAFEEVVVDRHTGRWVWHALRREESWSFDGPKSFTNAAQTWTQVLHHDLVEAVTQRGRVRNADSLPGARWVPPAEIANWAPGERAGLILVNRDHQESSQPTGPFARAQIRRADEVAVPYQRSGGTSAHHQFMAQRTPALPNNSYAAIELPPGEYIINFGGELRTVLKAGEKRVISSEVKFLRLGDTLTERTPEWFADVQPRVLRHGFLADTSAPSAYKLTVPGFLIP
jgi:hypothetical protein